MKPLVAHVQDRPPHCPVFSVCLSWISFLQGPGPHRDFLLLDGEMHSPRGASFGPEPEKIRQMARECENLSRIFAIASAFHWVTSAIQLTGKWQKPKATLSHTPSALSRLLVPLKSPWHGQRHMSLCTEEMALIHVCGVHRAGECTVGGERILAHQEPAWCQERLWHQRCCTNPPGG